jgi:hypothetical protein
MTCQINVLELVLGECNHPRADLRIVRLVESESESESESAESALKVR